MRGVGNLVQQRPGLVQALAAEAFRIVEHNRNVIACAHSQRLRFADIDDEIRRGLRVDGIGEPADPAGFLSAIGRARVPISH